MGLFRRRKNKQKVKLDVANQNLFGAVNVKRLLKGLPAVSEAGFLRDKQEHLKFLKEK